MKIDFKAPRIFILDISLLIDTLDSDHVLSPLAWQYCIESDLVDSVKLDILRSISPFPALSKHIAHIGSLQKRHNINIINCIPKELIIHLKSFQVEIKLHSCAMLLIAG